MDAVMRMKWTLDEFGRFVSADGRFTVGGPIWTKGGGCYVRLFDATTGKEYPCRTVASAKTAARNIANAAE